MTLTDQTPTARRAEQGDRDELNRVLSAAFLDDPVFAWLVPDRAERAPLLPPLFDAFADAFARHERTVVVELDASSRPSATAGPAAAAGTAAVIAGVAMWAPPGVAPIHADDEEDFGERLAGIAGGHIERFGQCMEVFEAAHPTEPAWFLQFLGVDPVHQGLGLGSRLLRDVLAAADRAGEAAYLEATSDRNRALYERHGFRWVADLVLPGGPTAYAMWRAPGGQG